VSNPLKQVGDFGQSLWYDYIRRGLIESGELQRLIDEDGLRGVTSNPSIFEKSISGSTDYVASVAKVDGLEDLDPGDLYETLAIKDIQDAADILRTVYDSLDRRDGYVSLEVSPKLAHDTEATQAEAERLWKRVDRENLMVKVPGTPQGIPAIRHLIGQGIKVNVTLLFSRATYGEVAQAYIAGLQDLAASGGDLSRVASVASFFVSRIDAAADERLKEIGTPEADALREPLGAPDAYGEDRLFAYVRLDEEPDAQQDLAVEALKEAGQAVVTISLADRLDVGGEIFRWELATAVAGSLIGIDPFDQPDVEASKVATRELTDEYEDTGELPEEDASTRGENIALYGADDVAGHLGQAGRGDYVALLFYGPRTEERRDQLAKLRTHVPDARRVASCVGFGPRFLHSTGQAYKGGPNSGVFLQITQDDAADLDVPGQQYTFGVVKAAQAAGDLTVLRERGRRALRVHLGPDVEAGWSELTKAIEGA